MAFKYFPQILLNPDGALDGNNVAYASWIYYRYLSERNSPGVLDADLIKRFYDAYYNVW